MMRRRERRLLLNELGSYPVTDILYAWACGVDLQTLRGLVKQARILWERPERLVQNG